MSRAGVVAIGRGDRILLADPACADIVAQLLPQAPGIDACGMAVKLMELTLATRA